MNFLKNLFSPTQRKKAVSEETESSHHPSSVKEECTDNTNATTPPPRVTVTFANLREDEHSPEPECMSGRKSHIFVMDSPSSASEVDEADDLAAVRFEAGHSLPRRFRTVEQWNLWSAEMAQGNTPLPRHIAFVQSASVALFNAARHAECYVVTLRFVSFLLRLFEKVPPAALFDKITDLAQNSRKRLRRHEKATEETIQSLLGILWRDAFHIQKTTQMLKVEMEKAELSETDLQNYTFEWQLAFSRPKITTGSEASALQHFIASRVAFAMHFAESAKAHLERTYAMTDQICSCIDELRFMWLATALTCAQKLQYPRNGPLHIALRSMCGQTAKKRSFTQKADFGKIGNLETFSCFSKSSETVSENPFSSPAIELTAEFTAKLAPCVFSVALMYLNAFQQCNQSRCLALHRHTSAIFTDVEVALDMNERSLFHRNANLAASIEERVRILADALSNFGNASVSWAHSEKAFTMALTLFEWICAAEKAQKCDLSGLLTASSRKFVLYVADFQHFDGQTSEAISLYAQLVALSQPSSKGHIEAVGRIHAAQARYGLSIEKIDAFGKITKFGDFPKILSETLISEAFEKFHSQSLSPGEFANTVVRHLSPWLPFLRTDSSENNGVVLSTTSQAHDVCIACCALGDVFLARDDAAFAAQLYLAVLKIVTPIATLCSLPMLLRACSGIAMAQGDRKRVHAIQKAVAIIQKTAYSGKKEGIDVTGIVLQTQLALQGFRQMECLKLQKVDFFDWALFSENIFEGVQVVVNSRSVQKCAKAMECAEWISMEKWEEAFQIIENGEICPFTVHLCEKMCLQAKLCKADALKVIDFLQNHNCRSCPAVDFKHAVFAAANAFSAECNAAIANLLLKSAGMAYDRMGEGFSNIEKTFPREVSTVCITSDSSLQTLWIARCDAFTVDNAVETHSCALQLPKPEEYRAFTDSFAALMRRVSDDIAIPKDDSNASRKRFWKQRRFFDAEIGLLVGKLGRLLGPLQALVLGLPVGDSLHTKLMSEEATKCVAEIREKLDFSKEANAWRLLSPYVTSVFLNYLQFQRKDGMGKERYQEETSALLESVLSAIAQTVNEPLVPVEREVLAQSLLKVFDSVLTNQLFDSTNSQPIAVRKVWLLLDHPLLERFPIERLALFEKAAAPVVRIASLQKALELYNSRVNRALVEKSTNRSLFERSPSLFYCLNPSGNMPRSEKHFLDIFRHVRHWKGVSGKCTSEECIAGIAKNAVYLYIGHGCGEKHTPRHKLVTYCGPAAVFQESRLDMALLMGCASVSLGNGAMRTPNVFLQAGSSLVVGTLWDVTDGEIDRLTTEFILQTLVPPEAHAACKGKETELNLIAKDTASARELFPTRESVVSHPVDIFAALRNAQKACKLPFLTGASVVMYGA